MGRRLAILSLLVALVAAPTSAFAQGELPTLPVPGLGPAEPAPTPAEPTPAEPAPGAPADKPGGKPNKPKPGGDKVVRLSNQRVTAWANFRQASAVRTRPGAGRRVASLHRLTVDRLPEVYVVLKSLVRDGRSWLQVRVPVRPRAVTGWVPREALGAITTVNTRITVSLAARRLTLYRAGRKVFSAPVGVGAPGTPTPRGNFWINEMFAVQDSPAYGPYALGITAFSPTLTDWFGGGVVGIHGTNQPSLIPGRISKGCIRLSNAGVTRLVQLAELGTPVVVR